MNQGPSYYGDLDEVDGKLLAYEHDAEDEGTFIIFHTVSLY
jgi:pre-mRNA-splicing factor ISY1